MKKVTLLKSEVMGFAVAFMIFLCLSFGFGYFFGRYEQIQINRSVLQVIPDVNCREVDE